MLTTENAVNRTIENKDNLLNKSRLKWMLNI
jgi:hypothetical protein